MKYLLAICLLTIVTWSCKTTIPPEHPNIVVINVDDMGWRDTGFMGSEYYDTPNIDSLAAMGRVFTNGYAAAANCAPSRACLMTGLWPPRHGIYTVGSSERGDPAHRKLIPVKNTTTLADRFVILPEILKQHQYITCHAGKWHLSDNPLDRGFDYNIGGGHNGHPVSYNYPYGNVDLPGNPGGYLTDEIMNRTVDFVRSVEGPFFLYYAPYAVHTPIQPVTGLLDKYQNKPPWSGQQNADYATMVENLDRNIGLLLESLKDAGVFDNTIIVFTSDNGGLYGITYQYPLRAGKGSYYDGGIRVPFFLVWKNKILPSEDSQNIITNLDIFPTLLEAAGIDLNGYSFDGKSLLPTLLNKTQLPDRPLFWHFPVYLQAYDTGNNQNRDSLFRTRPGSAVRLGDWKLHHYYENNEKELYNLKEDVSETNNLAEDQPEKVRELYTLLDDWRTTVQAPVPDRPNPAFVQLRQIGNIKL